MAAPSCSPRPICYVPPFDNHEAPTMQHMRALTLASAKHLMSMGHITPQHYTKIVASVAPMAPKAPKAKKFRPFGAIRGAQQAQAPIPGMLGPTAIPTGTATGYDDPGAGQ